MRDRKTVKLETSQMFPAMERLVDEAIQQDWRNLNERYGPGRWDCEIQGPGQADMGVTIGKIKSVLREVIFIFKPTNDLMQNAFEDRNDRVFLLVLGQRRRKRRCIHTQSA